MYKVIDLSDMDSYFPFYDNIIGIVSNDVKIDKMFDGGWVSCSFKTDGEIKLAEDVSDSDFYFYKVKIKVQ